MTYKSCVWTGSSISSPILHPSLLQLPPCSSNSLDRLLLEGSCTSYLLGILLLYIHLANSFTSFKSLLKCHLFIGAQFDHPTLKIASLLPPSMIPLSVLCCFTCDTCHLLACFTVYLLNYKLHLLFIGYLLPTEVSSITIGIVSFTYWYIPGIWFIVDPQ